MLEHVYTVMSSKVRGQLKIGQTDYVTNQQGAYAFEHVHPTSAYSQRNLSNKMHINLIKFYTGLCFMLFKVPRIQSIQRLELVAS